VNIIKINLYHTTTPESDPGHRNLYHDQNICPDGTRIQPEHRVSGTGNRPKCDWCKEL
jgi:hypothetical protein